MTLTAFVLVLFVGSIPTIITCFWVMGVIRKETEDNAEITALRAELAQVKQQKVGDYSRALQVRRYLFDLTLPFGISSEERQRRMYVVQKVWALLMGRNDIE